MLWQSQSSAKGLLEHLWSAIPMGRLTLVEMVEEVSSKLDALESSVDALSTKIKKKMASSQHRQSFPFAFCLSGPPLEVPLPFRVGVLMSVNVIKIILQCNQEAHKRAQGLIP